MAATGNFWEHQATTGWKHSKGSRLPKQKGITHTRIPRGNVAAIDAEREKGAELSQTGDAFDPYTYARGVAFGLACRLVRERWTIAHRRLA